VRLNVKAREAKNRGRADATMTSTVTPAGEGTHVGILTDLTLKGAVAQYGRGVVPAVAEQLTARFAECLQRQLADQAAAEPPTQPEPVGGLRLGLVALWRTLAGRFRS
jgi:uncharacterized protein